MTTTWFTEALDFGNAGVAVLWEQAERHGFANGFGGWLFDGNGVNKIIGG